MTFLHLIYIPACIVVGFVLGWVQGTKAAKLELAQLRTLANEAERHRAAERLQQAAGSNAP